MIGYSWATPDLGLMRRLDEIHGASFVESAGMTAVLRMVCSVASGSCDSRPRWAAAFLNRGCRMRITRHRILPVLPQGAAVTSPDVGTEHYLSSTVLRLMCLVAILVGYSRKVLAWRLSTLETRFCLDCLEDACQSVKPANFLALGSKIQFTSTAFTAWRRRYPDQRRTVGTRSDNIFGGTLWRSVPKYMRFCNGYQTVEEAYRTPSVLRVHNHRAPISWVSTPAEVYADKFILSPETQTLLKIVD